MGVFEHLLQTFPVAAVTEDAVLIADFDHRVGGVCGPDQTPFDAAGFLGHGQFQFQTHRTVFGPNRFGAVVDRLDPLTHAGCRRVIPGWDVVGGADPTVVAASRFVAGIEPDVVAQIDPPGRSLDVGVGPAKAYEELDALRRIFRPAKPHLFNRSNAQFQVEHRRQTELLVLRVEGTVQIQFQPKAVPFAVTAVGDGVDPLELFAGVERLAGLRERKDTLRAVRFDQPHRQIQRSVDKPAQGRVHDATACRLKQQPETAAHPRQRPCHQLHGDSTWPKDHKKVQAQTPSRRASRPRPKFPQAFPARICSAMLPGTCRYSSGSMELLARPWLMPRRAVTYPNISLRGASASTIVTTPRCS